MFLKGKLVAAFWHKTDRFSLLHWSMDQKKGGKNGGARARCFSRWNAITNRSLYIVRSKRKNWGSMLPMAALSCCRGHPFSEGEVTLNASPATSSSVTWDLQEQDLPLLLIAQRYRPLLAQKQHTDLSKRREPHHFAKKVRSGPLENFHCAYLNKLVPFLCYQGDSEPL